MFTEIGIPVSDRGETMVFRVTANAVGQAFYSIEDDEGDLVTGDPKTAAEIAADLRRVADIVAAWASDTDGGGA